MTETAKLSPDAFMPLGCSVPELGDLHFGSVVFYADRLDVLPKNYGIVFQSQNEGQFETIHFNAEDWQNGVYIWQFASANSKERELVDITISKTGIHATRRHFDSQLSLTEEPQGLSYEEASKTLGAIYETVTSEEAMAQLDKARERILKAELDIQSFAGNALGKYHPRKLQKLIKEKEKAQSRLGCVLLRPF